MIREYETRKAIEEKFGYDLKHALHLCRLLVQGEEILSGKGLKVRRTEDKDFFMKIKNGEYTYEWLLDWAEKQSEKIKNIKSDLQYSANRKKTDKLLVEILKGLIRDKLFTDAMSDDNHMIRKYSEIK